MSAAADRLACHPPWLPWYLEVDWLARSTQSSGRSAFLESLKLNIEITHRSQLRRSLLHYLWWVRLEGPRKRGNRRRIEYSRDPCRRKQSALRAVLNEDLRGTARSEHWVIYMQHSKYVQWLLWPRPIRESDGLKVRISRRVGQTLLLPPWIAIENKVENLVIDSRPPDVIEASPLGFPNFRVTFVRQRDVEVAQSAVLIREALRRCSSRVHWGLPARARMRESRVFVVFFADLRCRVRQVCCDSSLFLASPNFSCMIPSRVLDSKIGA